MYSSFVLCHFALDKYLSSEWSHLNTVLSVTFLYFRLFEYLLQSLISLTVTLESQHINLLEAIKKKSKTTHMEPSRFNDKHVMGRYQGEREGVMVGGCKQCLPYAMVRNNL